MGDLPLGARPDFDEDALEKRRVKEAVRARIFGDETGPLTIGPYEIRRRIGSGAMGVVYEAWDPRLRRLVALKMLLSESNDDSRTTRLIREAQALAQLRHPNVVGVHDVGTQDGRIYVVMEMVEGSTLEEWARATQPGVEQVLRMLAAVGHGLLAAHERGLIHRDVKPDNVLVDREGTPRVVDFGLARVAEADLLSSLVQQIPGAALDMKLTRTGTALGTPVYMSPEQLRGAPVDARSDQYSFAVMAYYLLYGDFPFRADSIGHLIAAVTNDELKPPTPRGEPAETRSAIMRSLSSDPEKRFPSLRSLVTALEATSHARPPPESPPERGLTPLLIAFIALALLGAVAVVGVVVGFLLAQPEESAVLTPPPPGPAPAAIPNAPSFDLDAAMRPSLPAPAGPPDATVSRDASVDARPTKREPSMVTRRHDPAPVDAPPRRRPPLRRIDIGSSENTWQNSRPMEEARRRLARPVSDCFDPDFDYEHRGGTQLGVTLHIDNDGRVTDVEVEDDDIPDATKACVRRVFRGRLTSFPPPLRRARDHVVWYVIPYRPVSR